MGGALGDAYREILAGCCVPVYWFRRGTKDFAISHNGTLTIVRTPKRLLGITAAHVVQQFMQDSKNGPIRLQLNNEVVDDLPARIIDMSENIDVATIALDEHLVKRLNKTPLSDWPPRPPQEGKGIMIAGFPGVERIESKDFAVSFGLFTALGVARTVTDCQITWLMERESLLPNNKIPVPPLAYDLGGISGGPLISWFETESHVAHHCLSGIVIQHPDYQKNPDMPLIERLIARRAEAIAESGMIV